MRVWGDMPGGRPVRGCRWQLSCGPSSFFSSSGRGPGWVIVDRSPVARIRWPPRLSSSPRWRVRTGPARPWSTSLIRPPRCRPAPFGPPWTAVDTRRVSNCRCSSPPQIRPASFSPVPRRPPVPVCCRSASRSLPCWRSAQVSPSGSTAGGAPTGTGRAGPGGTWWTTKTSIPRSIPRPVRSSSRVPIDGAGAANHPTGTAGDRVPVLAAAERRPAAVELSFPFSSTLAASLHDELFTHRTVSS